MTFLPFDAEMLEKWRNAQYERDDVVFNFLLRSSFKLVNTRGSHRTYEHPALARLASFTKGKGYIKEQSLESGRLVVISCKGKIKDYVLKRIVLACEYIEEYEALEAKHGGLKS